MGKFSGLTLAELLGAFSSNQPVPGGGSAAALTGAVGTSLFIMVAGLPRTKHGTDEERRALDAAAARLRPLRDELAALIDRDSDAYTSVIGAYRLPRATPLEQDARRAAIEAAMRAATEAPLATMRACERVMREARVIAASGAASAESDLAVGIELVKTAAQCAALNVDANLALLKDEDYVSRIRQERLGLEETIEGLLPYRP